MLRKLPNRMPIRLRELRARGWLRGDTNMEMAARFWMLEELDQHKGSVVLDTRGGGHRVYVYIDGSQLPLRDGRLHFDTFFGRVDVPMLEMQKAYYDALVKQGRHDLRYIIKANPWIAGMLIRDRLEQKIAADRTAAVSEEMGFVSAAEAEILRYKRERLERAEAIRVRVAGAMVTAAVLARFFAIEGASDLFLSLFPAGKAVDLVKSLGKARRARKLRKAEVKKLTAVLELDEAQFIRHAAKLTRRELKALEGIAGYVIRRSGDRVENAEILNVLMVKSRKGLADLG